MPYKVVPWATWKTVLLRMCARRVKIFGEKRPGRLYLLCICDGAQIHWNSMKALQQRRLIERTKNDGHGKITWSLTDKGRKAPKELYGL